MCVDNSAMPAHFIRGHGGIGRRVGFRIQYPPWCAGSSPVARTNGERRQLPPFFVVWANRFRRTAPTCKASLPSNTKQNPSAIRAREVVLGSSPVARTNGERRQLPPFFVVWANRSRRTALTCKASLPSNTKQNPNATQTRGVVLGSGKKQRRA